MAGRFVPTVDSRHDDEDNNSHMSDIPLQRPTDTNVSSDTSASVTFSQIEGDLDAEFSKSPSDTESDQGRSLANTVSQYIHPQGSPAVLGPHETVQLVTQRARENQNDQRETARPTLLHQQGELLAATHQYEAAARQNFVNI